MIELAAPWALALAPLAAAPLAMHLMRRRRPREVAWGAMRFLAVAAAEQRRRLSVQERVLLALRIAVLAAAALAAAQPAWVERGGDPVFARSGRVACVIAIDDSAGTAAGGGDAAVRALAQAWLGTLEPGDEVTVLPLSRLADPAADPLLDLAAAGTLIQSLRPTAVAPDHPALLLAGLERLRHHRNPHAELVLVAGGRAAGWHPGDARWTELGRRMLGQAVGSRERPQLVVLEPAVADVPDAAIVGLVHDGGWAAPRSRPELRATVAARGGARGLQRVRFEVDGRPIEEVQLAIEPGGEGEVRIRLPELEPGDHAVEAVLVAAGDAFPASDRRAVIVPVEARLPVVLVEGEAGGGLAGSLGAVHAALDPDDGADRLAPFAPVRIAASELLGTTRLDGLLAGAAAAVIGGVPALDPSALAAIERFVASGGGLLVLPGPGVDPAHWARAWWRGGDGVLPAAPIELRSHPVGLIVMPGTSADHPLARLFSGTARPALAEAPVHAFIQLAPAEDAAVPLLLPDGSPFAVERRRGAGRCMMLAIPLDGSWSPLPWRAAMAPLVRTAIASLAARPSPPRVLRPLERPALPVRAGSRLDGPGGPHELVVGGWSGREAMLGPPLSEAGVYTQVAADGEILARRAVASAPAAHLLAPSDPAAASGTDALGAWRAASPDAAAALVRGGERVGFRLWHWLLAMAIAILLLEAWLCGRAARQERLP